MRTSLNEIREAERFLTDRMITGHSLVFQAKMIVNPLHRVNVMMLKKVMEVVRYYHRKNLKRELKALHQGLLKSSAETKFQTVVRSILQH